MTLHIIHSNKVERLHDELCYLLKNNPLANPFEVETIVSPSKAMARWIHIRFTQQMGIAAHYDYPMPSSWVWSLAEQCLPHVPEQDPLQRELLAWKVFHYLDNKENKTLDNDELYAPIQSYLSNDTNSTKRWSLAKKIAFVFERYQHFRPDLIKQWNDSNTSAENWQQALWQSLTVNIDTDRVQLLENLGQLLSANKALDDIPQRVVFFSVSALPPLLFKNIQALAKHTEVYFFVLSPSAHYWSDLVSLKQQAKQRLKAPELNDYFSTGHELLASWGKQGQVFQDMLLYELDDSIAQHHDVYDDDFSPSVLNQLQQSLFDLSDDEININADNSIRFNLCHSPLRECEVLHDQCLELLEDSAITPEDILVIVPNMEQYAVTIESVFKKTPDQHRVKPFIPWNLSDSSLNAENPLINTFLNVLTLATSRFTVSDILAFLDCPEVLQRFQLEEADKATIRDYIQQAHIHWGFNASHKADFDVPEMLHNTWQQAQQRFYSFYAIDETVIHNGINPLKGFSSSRASVIAQFMLLLECLNEWRQKLAYARSVSQWQIDLNIVIDALFASDAEGSIQLIRDAIDELVTQSDAQHKTQLHRELVTQWLTDYFNNNQSNQRFFSGGITFCGMRPMRSVPFKVIVMLGMNEHDFPRHNKPIEFDLMASQWQPGDLLISDEDRYLFLEAMLCAREHLIISYCASSLKDNSSKEPSNLVSELRDYLDHYFKADNTDSLNISKQLSTQYAMHAFSDKNYSEQYRSYNQFWCDVAQKLNADSDAHDDANNENDVTALTASHSEAFNLNVDIEFKRLLMCLKDPIKFYFNSALNIRIYEDAENDDDEPFDLDALQKWGLKDRLIKDNIAHKNASLTTMLGEALLPHGAHATACYEALENDLEAQFETVYQYLSKTPISIAINLSLANDIALTGQITNYYPDLGLLLLTPSKFGSKPFIEGWLKHCALCAIEQLKPDEISVISCKDKTVSFKPLSQSAAQQFLLDAIKIMHQASENIITLLPKASFAYQLMTVMSDENKAQSEALKSWHGNPQNAASLGEKENEFLALAFQQFYTEPRDLFESDNFKDMAKTMYGNAFKHCDFNAELN